MTKHTPWLLFVVATVAACYVWSDQFYGESSLPPGTLAGLTEEQKQIVLKVINSEKCPCGCTNGSIARCRAVDKKCSTAPKLLAQTVQKVREGRTADQIVAEIHAAYPLRGQDNTANAPVTGPTTTKAPQAGRTPPPAVALVTIRPDDPFKGPAFAKVTIVEFSEFQCPFCARVSPTVKQILDMYPRDVKLVWKHLPLAFHKNAFPAAEAAEAAREQGKFWEMHDLLFQNQRQLSPSKYVEWAGQIGLDPVRFQESINERRYKARIEEDSRVANSIGITGTPAFFINGRRLSGAQPVTAFQKIIDEELQKANALLQSGKKLDAAFYFAMVELNKKRES